MQEKKNCIKITNFTFQLKQYSRSHRVKSILPHPFRNPTNVTNKIWTLKKTPFVDLSMLRDVLSAKCEFLDDHVAFWEQILKKTNLFLGWAYILLVQLHPPDDTPNLTFLKGKTLDFLDMVCPDNVCRWKKSPSKTSNSPQHSQPRYSNVVQFKCFKCKVLKHATPSSIPI